MTEYIYQYAVLRYVHDPVTQEFINIGVVLYAPNEWRVSCLFNYRYRRLSETFLQVNGSYLRTQLNSLQRRLESMQRNWERGSWLDRPQSIHELVSLILPPDDSSLVFGGIGGGLARDLDAELHRLYWRLVMRYAERDEPSSRDDAEVWQVFQKELAQRDVTEHLEPVTIRTETFSLSFPHAWKNEHWHPLEPVSLDLVHESSIWNKTNRWIGNTFSLQGAEDLGKIYILLGSPRRDGLLRAYENAIANMRKLIPQNTEIVREEEAAEFSERLAQQIRDHS